MKDVVERMNELSKELVKKIEALEKLEKAAEAKEKDLDGKLSAIADKKARSQAMLKSADKESKKLL